MSIETAFEYALTSVIDAEKEHGPFGSIAMKRRDELFRKCLSAFESDVPEVAAATFKSLRNLRWSFRDDHLRELTLAVRRALPRLTTIGFQIWELEIPDEVWSEALVGLDPATSVDFVASRQSPFLLRALAQNQRSVALALPQLVDSANESASDDSSAASVALGEAWSAAASSDELVAERREVAKAVRDRVLRNDPPVRSPFFDEVAAFGLDEDSASEFLARLGRIHTHAYSLGSLRAGLPRLFVRLASLAPGAFAAQLLLPCSAVGLWSLPDPTHCRGWPEVLPIELVREMRATLGRFIALRAAADQQTVEALLSSLRTGQRLQTFGSRLSAEGVDVIAADARLWSLLGDAKSYRHARDDPGRAGVHSLVRAAATADPQIWADSLEHLLEGVMDLDGLVEPITLELVSQSVIRDRLEALEAGASSPRIEQRAHGILGDVNFKLPLTTTRSPHPGFSLRGHPEPANEGHPKAAIAGAGTLTLPRRLSAHEQCREHESAGTHRRAWAPWMDPSSDRRSDGVTP